MEKQKKVEFKGSAADCRKELFATIKERKQMCSGSRGHKNGSKSKKCSLPSDKLTRKQWEAKNGPVHTFSINTPCGWDEFRAQPIDIQKMYIDRLVDMYSVSLYRISKMMGVIRDVLSAHLAVVGIVYPVCKSDGNFSKCLADRDGWNCFLAKTNWTTGYYEKPGPKTRASKEAAEGASTIETAPESNTEAIDQGEIATPTTNKPLVTITYTSINQADLIYELLNKITDLDINIQIVCENK